MGYMEELRALVGHRCVILNGSVAVVRSGEGRILLQLRDDGRWGLPGGLMELGESTEETARREFREETGLALGELRLVGVYSGADHLCRAANGDEWYVVNTVYAACEHRGSPRVCDGESLELAWFFPEEIPETLVGSHRQVLRDYLHMKEQGLIP